MLTAVLPAAADTLYNAGQAGIWGVVIRADSSMEAVVQPFRPITSGWAETIGIAIGSGADPNHVGFKFAITDTEKGVVIPGSQIAGSWNILPTSGASLVYAYIDITPVFLSSNKVYGLLIEPGDTEMYGSVAYTYPGPLAYGTSDGWATSFYLPYTTAIRIYGTAVVPEPSSLLALAAGVFSAVSVHLLCIFYMKGNVL